MHSCPVLSFPRFAFPSHLPSVVTTHFFRLLSAGGRTLCLFCPAMADARTYDFDASFVDWLAALPPDGEASEWWTPLNGLGLEKTPATATDELRSSGPYIDCEYVRDVSVAKASTTEHLKGLELSETESALKPKNISTNARRSETIPCLFASSVGLSCAINYSRPLLDSSIKEDFANKKNKSYNSGPKELEPKGLGPNFKPTHLRKQVISKGDHFTQRTMHIYSGRQRRINATSLFATLRSLLPEFEHKKANRCTILTEVVQYISSLREKLKGLERKKLELVWAKGIYQETSANLKEGHITKTAFTEPFVTVVSNGDSGQITLHTRTGKGLWPQIFLVLERRNIDVFNCTRCTGKDTCFYHFHVKAQDSTTLESEDLVKILQDLTATWLLELDTGIDSAATESF